MAYLQMSKTQTLIPIWIFPLKSNLKESQTFQWKGKKKYLMFLQITNIKIFHRFQESHKMKMTVYQLIIPNEYFKAIWVKKANLELSVAMKLRDIIKKRNINWVKNTKKMRNKINFLLNYVYFLIKYFLYFVNLIQNWGVWRFFFGQ